jgi:hypothetical protein
MAIMPQPKSRTSLSPLPPKSKTKPHTKAKTKLKFVSKYTSSDFNSDSDFDVNAEFDGDAYIARYELEQQEKIASEAAERVEREYARIHGGSGTLSSSSRTRGKFNSKDNDAGPSTSTSGSKAHIRSKSRDLEVEVEEVEQTRSRSRVHTSLEELQAESSTSLPPHTAGGKSSQFCDKQHHLSGLMKSRERLKESMRRPGSESRSGAGIWYETANDKGKGKGKQKERERTKEEVEMLEMKKVENEFYEKIKGMNIPPPPSTAVEKREIIE